MGPPDSKWCHFLQSFRVSVFVRKLKIVERCRNQDKNRVKLWARARLTRLFGQTTERFYKLRLRIPARRLQFPTSAKRVHLIGSTTRREAIKVPSKFTSNILANLCSKNSVNNLFLALRKKTVNK